MDGNSRSLIGYPKMLHNVVWTRLNQKGTKTESAKNCANNVDCIEMSEKVKQAEGLFSCKT